MNRENINRSRRGWRTNAQLSERHQSLLERRRPWRPSACPTFSSQRGRASHAAARHEAAAAAERVEGRSAAAVPAAHCLWASSVDLLTPSHRSTDCSDCDRPRCADECRRRLETYPDFRAATAACLSIAQCASRTHFRLDVHTADDTITECLIWSNSDLADNACWHYILYF